MTEKENNQKKIYFSGSIRGGRQNIDIYHEIIEYLKSYGQVLTEYVGDHYLAQEGEKHLTNQQIYKHDLAWLAKADLIIAEVTTPSLGVGYEIAMAVELNKPILCLYQPDKQKELSAMIAGCPNLTVACYKTLKQAKEAIDHFLSSNDINE